MMQPAASNVARESPVTSISSPGTDYASAQSPSSIQSVSSAPRVVASRPILAASSRATPSQDVCGMISHASTGSPTTGGGPVQFAHSIPPRPKPGRKPATDEPGSKRKAQNREAQRSFRQRKAMKLEELSEETARLEKIVRDLQQENHALKDSEIRNNRAENEALLVQLGKLQDECNQMNDTLASHKHTIMTHKVEKEALSSENNRLAAEIKFWKSKATKKSSRNSNVVSPISLNGEWDRSQDGMLSRNRPVQSETQPFMQPFTSPATALAPPTPPENQMPKIASLEHVEFSPLDDITSSDRKTSIQGNRVEASNVPKILKAPISPEEPNYEENEIDFTTKRPDLVKRTSVAFVCNGSPAKPVEPCGFCADDTYCPCADNAAAVSTDLPLLSEHQKTEIESNCPPSGPGSCDRCLADPEQRAWCQGLSKARTAFPKRDAATANASNILKSPDTLEPPTKANMSMSGRYSVVGCQEAYSLLGRPSIDKKPNEWGKDIIEINPVRQDSSHQRNYSAWELQIANHMIEVANTPRVTNDSTTPMDCTPGQP